MSFKKIARVFLSALLMLSCTACGQNPGDGGNGNGGGGEPRDEEPYVYEEGAWPILNESYYGGEKDPLDYVGAFDPRLSDGGYTDFDYTLANLVSTDIYGRNVLPKGDKANGPDVGMFYFVGMQEPNESRGSGIYDVSELLLNRPDSLWNVSGDKYSPLNASHYWGEPLFGYYHSQDPWLIDKHVQMLTLMGIDFIGVDLTNGYYGSGTGRYPEYGPVIKLLLDTLKKYAALGWNTPKLTFLTNHLSLETLAALKAEFYDNPEYADRWYRPAESNGKPYITSNTDLAIPSGLRSYFDIHHTQWPDVPPEQFKADALPWMDHGYPQRNQGGNISVSVAQHVANNMSYTDQNWGRGYDREKRENNPRLSRRGSNLASQWETVYKSLAESPDSVKRVFVTGFNEWRAGKYAVGGRIIFVDCFNEEYSRDIEPMKGGYGDNFYLQNIASVNLCKYEKPKAYKLNTATIDIGGAVSQWDGVKKYMDFEGDALERDFQGTHSSLTYADKTNRNDVVSTQVIHDSEYLYIRVTARDAITAREAGDLNWMNVWLGNGGREGFGDYNFVINRKAVSDGRASIEKSKGGGFDWEDAGAADTILDGNTIAFKIPLSAIGVDASRPTVKLKVSDNVAGPDNFDSFYLHGDSAPMGRLSYAYGL
ncbi:MAG: hypothetical protein LBL66_06275 [Clostridiales bacterium]|nr:hypothetical protein [Clostridiales bacterium]